MTVAIIVCAAVLAGCNSSPEPKAAVLGVAFAGPATLNLHQDIDAKSPAVAVARHADKLDIIGQRRRSWYKVRDAKGREGWVGNRDLLDGAQMKRLLALSAEAESMPSQGTASTFSAVNVHIEPGRQATSFVQVKEHEQFEVIGHKVAARVPLPVRQLIAPKPKAEKKGAKKGQKGESANDLQPPPAPAAPSPPADWAGLSQQGSASAEPAPANPVNPLPKDDWTLIRTRGGQSGWVLTSAIYLQIPDEVAQYAEGHRITSYFSIGKIVDGGESKDIWLWTTAERLGLDYDFDGYRVFSWSRRHHRYETSYIQRRERGFFPVLAKAGEFSVCLERKDGARARKQYRMTDTSVKPAGEKPCEKAMDSDLGEQNLTTAEGPPTPVVAKGLLDRVRTLWNGRLGKKE